MKLVKINMQAGQLSALVSLVGCLLFGGASAQEPTQYQWQGEWIAEGTLFKIAVQAVEGSLVVTPIESLGFEWTTSNGKIKGNTATIEVAYAGVTGIIAVELLDDNTARAWAQKCEPEFMVVCALAKDRQAIFVRAE